MLALPLFSLIVMAEVALVIMEREELHDLIESTDVY